MSRSFMLLDDDRVDEAFAVLQLVGRTIESSGRRQRISKTTLVTYRTWQTQRANFIVTDDSRGSIIGLVTLCDERLDDWPDFLELGPVAMIRALATHPDHVRTGIGDFAIRCAIEAHDKKKSEKQTAIYLDCVSGFLPSYYARLGFVTFAQQIREFDGDGALDITLMQLRR